MKLSQKLLDVLSNYAQINANIVIAPGNEIRTRNEDRTIGSRYMSEETFDKEVAIYSLPDFLSIYKVFEDPEVTFEDKFLTIKDKHGRQKYVYANKNALTYSEKSPPQINHNYEFDLKKDTLARLMKTTKANGFEFISFNSSNGKLSIIAGDLNKDTKEFDASANLYTVDVDVDTIEDFNIAVSVADLQMLIDDYTIGIVFMDNLKVVHLFNSSIEYWISIQKFSKFGS